MAKEPDWERHTLVYPKDLCDPKEQLNFVQLDPYTSAFISLGLTDDEQRKVEIGIMMHPTLAPVIEGSGGVREFQFSTPQDSAGSLHLSAFYAYFPEHGKLLLIDLVQTADISTELLTIDERRSLKELFEEIQRYLDG